MACKKGIREEIEASKRESEARRRNIPFNRLWESLIGRVRDGESYDGLNDAERLYYAVTMLDMEVENGGFDQFFFNDPIGLYQDAVKGLLEMKAPESLRLLLRAKEIAFGDREPPRDRLERWRAMREDSAVGAPPPDWRIELNELDKSWYTDPDQLGDKMDAFAEEQGLVAPFRRDVQ